MNIPPEMSQTTNESDHKIKSWKCWLSTVKSLTHLHVTKQRCLIVTCCHRKIYLVIDTAAVSIHHFYFPGRVILNFNVLKAIF